VFKGGAWFLLWFVVGCSRLACIAITHVSPSTPTARPQDWVVTELPCTCTTYRALRIPASLAVCQCTRVVSRWHRREVDCHGHANLCGQKLNCNYTPLTLTLLPSSLPLLLLLLLCHDCRSPAPGEPPFVKDGDRVKKGQTVCIIEAMKLMNEIEVGVRGAGHALSNKHV